jgi:hypothetical protein
MPGAVYNGNRFKSIKTEYPPFIMDTREMKTNFETTVTDIPRLSNSSVTSQISLLSGDMSTPCIGFFDSVRKKGILITTQQETNMGNIGISFDENLEQNKANIKIQSPGIRYGTKYTTCNMDLVKSDDKSVEMNCGDELTIVATFHEFECSNINEFFNFFLTIRKEYSASDNLINSIPFSAAWKIQENVYNSNRWNSEHNYYYSFPAGFMNNIMDYQLGWVGGSMCTQALILEGKKVVISYFLF